MTANFYLRRIIRFATVLIPLFSMSLSHAKPEETVNSELSDIECQKIKQFLSQQGWHSGISKQGKLMLWQNKENKPDQQIVKKQNNYEFNAIRKMLEEYGWQVKRSMGGDLLLWPPDLANEKEETIESTSLPVQIIAPRTEIRKMNTPAVAPAAIPMLDLDNDRVPDSIDICTGSTNEVAVNKFGCEAGKNIILVGVNFLSGSADLTNDAKPILDQQAEKLLKHPDFRFKIVGHTDSTGSNQLNRKLSKQRAVTVANYLMEKKVSSDKIIAEGRGESEPVATNSTATGRAKNRRVELQPQVK